MTVTVTMTKTDRAGVNEPIVVERWVVEDLVSAHKLSQRLEEKYSSDTKNFYESNTMQRLPDPPTGRYMFLRRIRFDEGHCETEENVPVEADKATPAQIHAFYCENEAYAMTDDGCVKVLPMVFNADGEWWSSNSTRDFRGRFRGQKFSFDD